MAIVSLSPAGAVGIVKDIPATELVPQAWSDGLNARFKNGGVGPFKSAKDLGLTLPTQPLWMISTPKTPSNLSSWLMASTTKAYAYEAGVLHDVTRVAADYTGSEFNRWSGGVLGGCTVINNGVDVPQAWMGADPTVELIDLPAWQSGVRAKVLRSFKQHLIALNITRDGTKYRSMVKWSHPADPGSVPSSWDESDPTKDCGEYSLSETPGEVIDCLPLKDVNIIYKDDSVWGMQYIGGMYIFRFFPIFKDFGMPRQDCVVEYGNGQHMVFTGSDIISHNGQESTSILSGKMRKLVENLSEDQIKTAFMTLNIGEKEVWFCWRRATDGAASADTAIVFNWIEKTLTLRELPNYRFISFGPFDPPGAGNNTWGAATNTWAEDHEAWGVATIVPAASRLLAIGTGKIEWVDSQTTYTEKVQVERTHLGVAMRAQQAPDMSTGKFLSRIWPRVKGKVGDVLFFTLGGSDEVNTDPTWQTPQQFIIGTDTFIDAEISAKTFAIRVEAFGGSSWSFQGADAEIIPNGV